MCTYDGLLCEGRECLRQAGIVDSDVDSWYLLEHVSGMSRSQFFLRRQERAPEQEIAEYRKLLKCRGAHMPLQYLTGSQEFMGLSFQVNEHVLVPRQDTECLVERVLRVAEGKKVLDMCTGSGCIAVSLAVLGKLGSCAGADISQEALRVAEGNARLHNVEVAWLESNLFEDVEGSFDIIVSNPPYIPLEVIEGLMPEVRDYEPRIALEGGEDGLEFYRRISGEAARYLEQGGFLFYEIGHGQGEAVRQIMLEAGFQDVECEKDYSGHDRVAWGRL